MCLRIGIDFGGVCQKDSETYESSVIEGNNIFDIEECESTLKKLRADGHKLILISFCGRSRAEYTRKLVSNYFDELYFVKNRDYKTIVCENRCVDIMIDDRLDILKTLKCSSLHFCSHQSDANEDFIPTARADSWEDVYRIINNVNTNQKYELKEVPKKFIYV